MLRAFFLFALVFLFLEIVVLLQVGSWLGGMNTFALLVLTAIGGVVLVRMQGMRNLIKMQQKMARGQLPGLEMASGPLLFLAGILLILPGFIGDLIGLLLLLTPVRKAIARYAVRHMVVVGQGFSFRQTHTRPADDEADGTTIDGEYSEKRGPRQQLDQRAGDDFSDRRSDGNKD